MKINDLADFIASIPPEKWDEEIIICCGEPFFSTDKKNIYTNFVMGILSKGRIYVVSEKEGYGLLLDLGLSAEGETL